MTSLDSYKTLGRSGLRVSPLALGTMTFGEDQGWGASPEASEAILAEYLDRGGNLVDTANICTNGHSEKIVGDFFAARPGQRERIVLSTKFFGNLHPGDPNGGGAGRKSIIAQLEESLRRLQTEYVDLYWLHNWDRRAPIEETLRALDDLVTAGKVRYVGFSDVPAWVAAQAQTIAHFRGWAPVTALQIEYSLLERTSEGELLPMAEALGLGGPPWSPLRGGQLSGKYVREEGAPADSPRADHMGLPNERDWVVIDAVARSAPRPASARRRSRWPGCAAGPPSPRRSSVLGPSSSCAPTWPRWTSPLRPSSSPLSMSRRRRRSPSLPPTTPGSGRCSASVVPPWTASSSRCGPCSWPAPLAIELLRRIPPWPEARDRRLRRRKAHPIVSSVCRRLESSMSRRSQPPG
jgi:aryl-alcohol dehydrogenase-like predicted oxidoreductase